MSSEESPTLFAIRLTERAQRNIDAATVRFAETVSPEVAIEWRDGLYQVLASLAIFPRRYPTPPETFGREVRQLVYRRSGSAAAYRIFFAITGENPGTADAPTVTVLHLRHAASKTLTRGEIRDMEFLVPPETL